MSLVCFLNILSGLGMFLYGMNLLSDSLERFAGSEVKSHLKKVASTPLKGVLLGAGVTGIIQSSTATTLITAGLINAGIMDSCEALPVIMGANIGTTVTGQILRLGEISDINPFFNFLKPSVLGSFFVLIGAFEKLFFKKEQHKQGADIFIGTGILFLGMEMMEQGVAPLSESEKFCNLFTFFENPFISFFIGTATTAIIQSSSVVVGILQSLTVTKTITFSSSIPIVLGMNIGKVLPEFIATLGTDKNTARTIFADLTVNICGVIMMSFIIYISHMFFRIPFWNSPATRSMIANFHTVFNLFTTLVMLPFHKQFISLSEKIIR